MKILVAYASKYGAAQKCAQMIAERLKGEVEVINLKKKKDIDCKKYDVAIIGGSIYAGLIQKEIKDFCTQNLPILKQKKIGLFISCMGEKDVPTFIQNAFPQELIDIAGAKESCGGIINFHKMSFFEKFIIKMIAKFNSKEQSSLLPAEGKNDVETISEEKINYFVSQLNIE